MKVVRPGLLNWRARAVSELQQFFSMGGYAFYVWASYGIAFIVLVANVWFASRELRMQRRQTRQRALLAPSRARRQASATRDAALGTSATTSAS